MILSVDLKNSHTVNSFEEFIELYNAREWLNRNIHLYDELMSDTNGISSIIRDFFEESRLVSHILFVNGKWIITVFKIDFAVVTGNKVIPANTFDKAKELFCDMAKKKLGDKSIYKQYPKGKTDYSVLKKMVEQEGINLNLIG